MTFGGKRFSSRYVAPERQTYQDNINDKGKELFEADTPL